MTNGMTAALAPRASLRESRGELTANQVTGERAPQQAPAPAAALGIQANIPTSLMSKPRAS